MTTRNPSIVLLVTVFTVLTLSVSVRGGYMINSPRITSWGDWGRLANCTPGEFVNGMRLKVEPIKKTGIFGYSDNTGLNAVKLSCGPIGKPINYLNGSTLTSAEGGGGSWGTVLYCPQNTFVTGFQLRSERSKGSNFFSWFFGFNSNDDTAANNLRLFCSEKTPTIEGYGTAEGSWTSSQHCLERQAVCGFRTQVEQYKGTGDDTGLNNVDMVCCDIPNPAQNCTPEEIWDVVKECDNTFGLTNLDCNYQRKIGISNSKVASKADMETYNNLGFDFKSIGSMLTSSFGSGTTASGSKNIWTSSSFQAKSEETVHGLTFSVLPGYKTELIQIVGTCGIYSIRTPKFIRSDTNMSNETSIEEIAGNGTEIMNASSNQ